VYAEAMKWLERNWPVSTIFLAVFVTLMLVVFVRHDWGLFLIWAQLPVYFIHQFEEYVLPGGFAKFFNRHTLGSARDDWPLTLVSSVWINLPIVFIAFPVSAVLATELGLSYGLWIVYFSMANALSHIVMLIIFRRYNPGLVASVVLNIPVGIWAIIYLSSHNLVSLTSNIVGLVIGLAVQVALMVYGFAFLKPRIRAAANA
jgi:hypothetical protein